MPSIIQKPDEAVLVRELVERREPYLRAIAELYARALPVAILLEDGRAVTVYSLEFLAAVDGIRKLMELAAPSPACAIPSSF